MTLTLRRSNKSRILGSSSMLGTRVEVDTTISTTTTVILMSTTTKRIKIATTSQSSTDLESTSCLQSLRV